MRFDVITLFPEFFPGPLTTGLVGKAFAEGRAEIDYIDPRDFTQDRHRTVDDTPYGGGAGMVMKVEPLASAIEAARARGQGPVVLMSPQGAPLRQANLRRWARADQLVLVTGRYEGFDERVLDLVDEEVSIGDYVLTGGEYAALTIIDGVVRLLPGTLGNQVSHETDSFEEGLLEHPQYTRPAVFRGQGVPEVLKSGDHARIAAWRRAASLERTRARRPDLLEGVPLEPADRAGLWALPPGPRPGLAVAGAPSDALFERLTQLAEAYALDGVAFVVEGELEAARATLAACPPVRVTPAARPPKRRRDRPSPVAVNPADRIRLFESWAALAASAPCALVGCARHSPADPRAVVSLDALRAPREDGRRWILAVGKDLVDERGTLAEPCIGAFPGLRAGTRLVQLEASVEAALVLDRVLGEA